MNRVHLGDEHDSELLRAVKAELGSRHVHVEHSWHLAGPQELTTLQFVIDGAESVIEVETYMGVTIQGPHETVESLAASIHRRLGR